MTPDQAPLKGEHMSEAEVNWRDLKEGERVKVEFEATVEKGDEHRVIFNVEGGDQGSTVFIARELDASKITRIERPWKVGDRFTWNGHEYEITSPLRQGSYGVWSINGPGGHGGIAAKELELPNVTRLEPSDDR